LGFWGPPGDGQFFFCPVISDVTDYGGPFLFPVPEHPETGWTPRPLFSVPLNALELDVFFRFSDASSFAGASWLALPRSYFPWADKRSAFRHLFVVTRCNAFANLGGDPLFIFFCRAVAVFFFFCFLTKSFRFSRQLPVGWTTCAAGCFWSSHCAPVFLVFPVHFFPLSCQKVTPCFGLRSRFCCTLSGFYTQRHSLSFFLSMAPDPPTLPAPFVHLQRRVPFRGP